MLRLLVLFIFFIMCNFFAISYGEAAEKVITENDFKISINIPSRTLTLYAGDKVFRSYLVGIGRENHQTPVGDFIIRNKELNPTWVKPTTKDEPAVTINSGPENPLGYRWMEFAELYGIHGTNRPDSIGGFVSNGCIRMREADVEELYDLVPLKTPVHIGYNRLVVQKKTDGMVSLTIYPDEYNRQSITLQDVKNKLITYGVADFITNEQLYEMLESANGQTVDVAKTFFINIFGKKLQVCGAEVDGIKYVPVLPIATECKMAVSWDYENGVVVSPLGSVPGYVKNDVLYIKTDYVYALFGVYLNTRQSSDTVYMSYSSY